MTDAQRLHDTAARVVAWHNRHPLARRITAAQVQSVGYVVLPFSVVAASGTGAVESGPAPGVSLRERARAQAQGTGDGIAAPLLLKATHPVHAPAQLQAGFSEDFIAPLAPARVAQWARRHGQRLQRPLSPDVAPLRSVQADALPPGRQPALVMVLTAAIEAGGERHRVLLSLTPLTPPFAGGSGAAAAVLGRRLWSKPRAAGLGALLLAVGVGVGSAGPWLEGGGAAETLRSAGALAAAASLRVTAAASAAATAAQGPVELAAADGFAGADDSAQPAGSGERAEGALTTAAAGAADAGEAADAMAPAAPLVPPPGNLPEPPAAAAAAAPVSVSATAAAPPVDIAAPAALPPDAEPRLGRIALPALGLPVQDEARAAVRRARLDNAAAARESQAAAGAVAGVASAAAADRPAVPAAVTATATAAATAATAAGANPAAIAAPAFALSSRVLRTRAEAELVRDAMVGLLQSAAAGAPPLPRPVQVDVLPQGDDWRVVGWPYGQRVQAEQARTLLVSRGLRVEVVAF